MRYSLLFLVLLLSTLPAIAQLDTLNHEVTDTIPISISDDNFIETGITKDSLNYELLIASETGNTDKVLALLLLGADVNSKTEEGVTPLMFAAQNGNMELTQILLFNGADVNLMPIDGSTALIAATRFNHDDIMDTLIQHGAFLDISTTDGATALIYACAYGYYIAADMLIYYGADINHKSRDGVTPLMVATDKAQTEIVKLLLEKGALLNKRDTTGWTALHYTAADSLKLTIMKMLIEKGADVDATTKGLHTPLIIAAEYGNTPGVKLLISNKANPNLSSLDGYTAYRISKEERFKAISKLLEESGVKPDKKLHFSYINISPLSIIGNKRDFAFNLNVSIPETTTGFRLNTGYITRLWGTRVRVPITDNNYYQFWERRSSFYFGIEKVFTLYIDKNISKGIYVGLNGLYTYGHYRGSTTVPDKRIIPSVGLGYMVTGKVFGAKLGFSYQDYNIVDFSPVYFTGSVFFCINRRAYTATHYKPIKWI